MHVDVDSLSSTDQPGIDPESGLLSKDFVLPESVDVVVYLVQSPYYHQVPEMAWHLINMNVVCAIRFAELARNAKVKRFIYTSSGNVYKNSFKPLSENAALCKDNWYSLSKIQAEEALSLYRNDMNVIIVRPFGVYGPGQKNNLIPNLVNLLVNNRVVTIDKNPIDTEDIDGLRITPCYISDFVEIYFRLIEKGGPDYINIADDEITSIRQMCDIISDLTGKEAVKRITCNHRSSDLIADSTLLKKVYTSNFTGIKQGLNNYFNSVLNSNSSSE